MKKFRYFPFLQEKKKLESHFLKICRFSTFSLVSILKSSIVFYRYHICEAKFGAFCPKNEVKMRISNNISNCDSICGLRQIFQLKKSVGAFCGNEASNPDGLSEAKIRQRARCKIEQFRKPKYLIQVVRDIWYTLYIKDTNKTWYYAMLKAKPPRNMENKSI